MSLVKFATLCDKCGARSVEYSTWWICQFCGDDICSQCDNEKYRLEEDYQQPRTTVCMECHLLYKVSEVLLS